MQIRNRHGRLIPLSSCMGPSSEHTYVSACTRLCRFPLDSCFLSTGLWFWRRPGHSSTVSTPSWSQHLLRLPAETVSFLSSLSKAQNRIHDRDHQENEDSTAGRKPQGKKVKDLNSGSDWRTSDARNPGLGSEAEGGWPRGQEEPEAVDEGTTQIFFWSSPDPETGGASP